MMFPATATAAESGISFAHAEWEATWEGYLAGARAFGETSGRNIGRLRQGSRVAESGWLRKAPFRP